jgi:hypothetical protein
LNSYSNDLSIEASLHDFLAKPTPELKDQLLTDLLHQGWRFQTTKLALERILKLARSDVGFLRESIDLILALSCGDLVQIFPAFDFYRPDSAALRLSEKLCSPPRVACEIRDSACSFASVIADSFHDFASSLQRSAALQFLLCFLPDRKRVEEIAARTFELEEVNDKLAATTIKSLLGLRVSVSMIEGSPRSVRFTCEDKHFVLSLRVAREIVLDVMSGAWEIALIPGVARTGDWHGIEEMVRVLDEWRQSDYEVARKKFLRSQ